MSQNELILARLRDGPLTAIEALQGIGCLRLAARIDELRRQGHPITVEKIRTDGGKCVARYRLGR